MVYAMTVVRTVDKRENLTADEFYSKYVKNNLPVIISGALDACPALLRWDLNYLRTQSGSRTVYLKEWYSSELRTSQVTLNCYLDSIEAYEERHKNGDELVGKRPAYLHDIPLSGILANAIADLAPFPVAYFPAWYRNDWWKFAQFFLGPSQSITPLHFDTLLSHNLFFQIMGRKHFILIPYDQRKYCYRYQWRWFQVNPAEPDLKRFPLYRRVRPMECTVGPGDLLYMPPGMLHHVRSLNCAMSFNVDWHTIGSAFKGMLGLSRGMPLINAYYNAVIALGLSTQLSAKRVLPFYKSYLNYIS